MKKLTIVLTLFLLFGAFVWKIELNEGLFTDKRDGQSYKWVRLKDGKKWMAQNLNFKIGTEKDCKCYMSNLTENGKEKYADAENCLLNRGRMYSWYAAKRACPEGWYLPSNEDWSNMVNLYGGYSDKEVIDSGKKAYKALKKKKNGNFMNFWSISEPAFYWTETRNSDSKSAYAYGMLYSIDRVVKDSLELSDYGICRCIQN